VLVDGVLLLKPREAVAEAAETVGGRTVGSRGVMGMVRWRQPLSEGGWRGSDAVGPWFALGG
jgi:hypothetical protein